MFCVVGLCPLFSVLRSNFLWPHLVKRGQGRRRQRSRYLMAEQLLLWSSGTS